MLDVMALWNASQFFIFWQYETQMNIYIVFFCISYNTHSLYIIPILFSGVLSFHASLWLSSDSAHFRILHSRTNNSNPGRAPLQHWTIAPRSIRQLCCAACIGTRQTGEYTNLKKCSYYTIKLATLNHSQLSSL